mgnify:CR=1 FL=1
MQSINRVTLLGRAGRDGDVRFTSGGKAVTNFSLATDRSWKQGEGDWKKETTWHSITHWGEIHVSKGDTLYVDGRIQVRKFEGRDGVEKTVVEVVAETVAKIQRDAQPPAAPASRPAPAAPPVDDDDIPF